MIFVHLYEIRCNIDIAVKEAPQLFNTVLHVVNVHVLCLVPKHSTREVVVIPERVLSNEMLEYG
jgi:hypothetical protein